MTAFRVKGFIQTSEGLYLADCMGNVVNLSPNSGPMLPEKVGRLVVLSGAGMPIRARSRSMAERQALDLRFATAGPDAPFGSQFRGADKYRGWNFPAGAFFS